MSRLRLNQSAHSFKHLPLFFARSSHSRCIAPPQLLIWLFRSASLPLHITMSDCCRSCCGMSPKIVQLIQDKLKDVGKIFPNTNYIVVLTPEGGVIAQGDVKAKAPDELLQSISFLKKTAIQFASTLGQVETPVIHIRGNTHLFSCYEVDKNILAFYSQMHSAALESFSTADADSKMQNLISELRLLLQNLQS